MKRKLLIAGCVALGAMVQASAQDYERRFEASYTEGGTYEALSAGATDVGFDADWDDEVSEAISLPFEFTYQNVPVEDLQIETYGSLLLNGLMVEDMEFGHILGLNMDYASAGRGRVLYETTGETGSRIFKVEFSNVGRFSDDTETDTLNFQIWLYEADNAIEYRAGYSNVPAEDFALNIMDLLSGKEAILCGLASNMGDEISTMTDELYLHAAVRASGDFSDTVVAVALLATETPDLELANAILHGTYPPSGSVIRFAPTDAPPVVGLPTLDVNMASVYPNPSTDGMFTLKLKEAPEAGAKVSIFDLNGRFIQSVALTQAATGINLSQFAAGNYFGKIENGNRQGIFKITKN